MMLATKKIRGDEVPVKSFDQMQTG